jgi:16S rRNA processing protein RimM
VGRDHPRPGGRTIDVDDLVEIGRVSKPWGVRGEVKVRLTTDIPDRFQGLEGVWIHENGKKIAWYRIEQVKRLKLAVALKLEGIESPEEAELLRNREVAVPENERAELNEGEFFIYDLIGLEVVDRDGRRLGELTKVYQGSAQDVFEITTPDGARLVPVVSTWVTAIEPEQGRVVLTLPEIEEAGEG